MTRAIAAFAAVLTILARLHLVVPAGRVALLLPAHIEAIAAGVLIAGILTVIAIAVMIVRALREPAVRRSLPVPAQYTALLEGRAA